MSKKLHSAVILTKYSPRKDKSVLLSFETQEKTAQEIGELHDLVGTYGFLVFKSENQLTTDEIEDINNLETELHGKTKSKKLQNVLFVRWNKGDKDITFNEFYAREMDIITAREINRIYD